MPLSPAVFPPYEQGGRCSVGKCPLVAQWILGNRSLSPPQRSLVPPWYLLVVLVVLTEKSYAPWHLAPPRWLMLKVLFLLAFIHQVSELHALCIDPPFLIQNLLSFLSWHQTLHFSQRWPQRLCLLRTLSCHLCTQSLLALWSDGSTYGVLTMLRIYLQRTACSWVANGSLFTGTRLKAISKQWISAAFLGQKSQSISLRNLSCAYLLVLMYICQTSSLNLLRSLLAPTY